MESIRYFVCFSIQLRFYISLSSIEASICSEIIAHPHLLQEVLDGDDAKLKLLRFEYGDDVCNAVKTALMEINMYNPSERDLVPEFWNFRKGRKATIKEVLYLFGHMEMTTKRRRG